MNWQDIIKNNTRSTDLAEKWLNKDGALFLRGMRIIQPLSSETKDYMLTELSRKLPNAFMDYNAFFDDKGVIAEVDWERVATRLYGDIIDSMLELEDRL